MQLSFLGAALGLSVTLLTGCAIQQGPTVAERAQVEMVGMSRERVLACMGPPRENSTIGSTEVWTYRSTDGATISRAEYRAARPASGPAASPLAGFVSGLTASMPDSSATARTQSPYCNVNVVFSAGRVSAVNYSGPTDRGRQCVYAVQNCTP